MDTIKLPEVTIKYGRDVPKTALMVLGGRKPSAAWFRQLDFYASLWAVDKGIEVCMAAEAVPDMLIGDSDSASAEAIQWALDNGVRTKLYDSCKDLTDCQLALSLANAPAVFMTGAFGGRFDHLWSLVISFLYGGDYLPLGMADGEEGMIFLNGPAAAELSFDKEPKALSLISFSEECKGVSLSGTRWPLCEAVLQYKRPYSISNRINSKNGVKVTLSAGKLCIYWYN